MKTRGKAIRSALSQYNKLAVLMVPENPPTLKWKNVVNYTFISEFNLLCNAHSHDDIIKKPWAIQLNREVASKFFKILRAQDEIIRLNVECRRLQTRIRNEEEEFRKAISNIIPADPFLAAKIHGIYVRQARVNHVHKVCRAIQALPGFNGWMDAGRWVGSGDNDAQMEDYRTNSLEGQLQSGEADIVHGELNTGLEGVDIADDDDLHDEIVTMTDFMEDLAWQPISTVNGIPKHMLTQWSI